MDRTEKVQVLYGKIGFSVRIPREPGRLCAMGALCLVYRHIKLAQGYLPLQHVVQCPAALKHLIFVPRLRPRRADVEQIRQ